MAAKGGDGLCLLHVVPKKQRASQPPIDPTVSRLQEIFIFYASLHDLATIEYGK